jgi:hypothetical protein
VARESIELKPMANRPDLALSVALVTLAVIVAFIAYAITGADLCLWCR